MPLDPESFKADAEQRMFAPGAAAEKDRRGLVAAVIAACGLHALTLGVVTYQWDLSATQPPSEREIPVEILVEPPPPKPPQPPAANSPLDEQTAHDAPRDATKEQASRDGEEEASQSRPAPPTPEPAATRPDATKSAENSAKEEPEAQSEPVDAPLTKTESDLSPEREAQAEPPSKPVEADANSSSTALPAFVGLPFPKWRKGEVVPNFAPLPDFKIASAAEAAPVGGGKAKATYLSVLYGLIMARLQSPAVNLAARAGSEGVIVFTISGAGKLVSRTIQQPSGSNELDGAAYAAVGEGAPYPPPPYGEQIELRFTYGPK